MGRGVLMNIIIDTLSGRGTHNPPKYTLLTQPPEPRPLKFCRNFFLSIAPKVTCDQAVLLEVAWVAGVRKGRGRELGRKTSREGEGRRGTPIVIKKITKITQL